MNDLNEQYKKLLLARLEKDEKEAIEKRKKERKTITLRKKETQKEEGAK